MLPVDHSLQKQDGVVGAPLLAVLERQLQGVGAHDFGVKVVGLRAEAGLELDGDRLAWQEVGSGHGDLFLIGVDLLIRVGPRHGDAARMRRRRGHDICYLHRWVKDDVAGACVDAPDAQWTGLVAPSAGVLQHDERLLRVDGVEAELARIDRWIKGHGRRAVRRLDEAGALHLEHRGLAQVQLLLSSIHGRRLENPRDDAASLRTSRPEGHPALADVQRQQQERTGQVVRVLPPLGAFGQRQRQRLLILAGHGEVEALAANAVGKCHQILPLWLEVEARASDAQRRRCLVHEEVEVGYDHHAGSLAHVGLHLRHQQAAGPRRGHPDGPSPRVHSHKLERAWLASPLLAREQRDGDLAVADNLLGVVHSNLQRRREHQLGDLGLEVRPAQRDALGLRQENHRRVLEHHGLRNHRGQHDGVLQALLAIHHEGVQEHGGRPVLRVGPVLPSHLLQRDLRARAVGVHEVLVGPKRSLAGIRDHREAEVRAEAATRDAQLGTEELVEVHIRAHVQMEVLRRRQRAKRA
mmetsp:Transcript_14050/g.52704  ORF Transcript_14050/g.52704 Transcript_14050/m.52704 type:complete len:523 (+) Transcript_14050:2989-4557(+)